MDILQVGAQLLKDRLNTEASGGQIQQALGGLLGGEGGTLDLSELASRFMGNGGLQSIVGSWLGDGDNEPITPKQLMDMFGAEKIGDFASRLGIDSNSALAGLSEVLPLLIDRASSGGSILDSLSGVGDALESAGGAKDLLGMAKNLFGR